MESNSNHYLCTHGGLQFLLKCDYNAPCIKHYLPSIFYRDLAVFQEFKNKTKVCSFGDFLLWNNETITAEKNMLFSKSWFNKKFFIYLRYPKCWLDLLEEFQNKFSVEKNYLNYFQLMAAIPSDLKTRKPAQLRYRHINSC